MFLKTIAAGFIAVISASFPLQAQEMQMMPAQQQPADEVVATVDGEEIYMSELENAAQTQMLALQMMQIVPQFGQFLQSESGQHTLDEYRRFVLDNVIDEKLLAQKAGREGIEVSEAEIDEHFDRHINNIKTQHGLTEEELASTLQQQGISSLDEYKDIFVEHSNLEEQKLLEEAGIEADGLEEYVHQLRQEAEIEIRL